MNWLYQLVFMITFAPLAWSQIPVSQYEHLVGKKAGTDNKGKWDSLYSQSSFVYGKLPAQFIADNYDYIPFGSSILDVGMGEGRNAVFLAQKGYKVTGIDLSTVAIKKSQILAKERNVTIKTIVGNVSKYNFPKESFDAVICFYYVDRTLIDKLKEFLKPGGYIIYEANTVEYKSVNKLASDPDHYYLKNGELIKLFSDFRILKFEEPIHRKNYISSIIAQKK